MYKVITATTEFHYHEGAALFKEYADSLDITLSFQSFENELTILPEMYGPPTGALLLVEHEGKFIGAVGLRRIENDLTCEIKRMYIKPGHQGKGIGKMLMAEVLDAARKLRYETIKLDTVGPKMPVAVKLYTATGFKETKPYNFNPYEGALYFEMKL